MGPKVARVACAWLLAASLLCTVDARDGGFQGPDGQDEATQLNRKLLSQNGGELGCPCSHEGHVAGECPCHLDTTWLENDECPSCPVYACGECDPLKCDECKRCCDGTVLSDDRKTCSCPSCDITGCLECDAEDCSKCLVCSQGYGLTADRKCDWKVCKVDNCQRCDLLSRYKCVICDPPLVLASDGKSCECPECAIYGCAKCDPKKCDECLECAGNLEPSYDKSSCPKDGCECKIPHCFECEEDCETCRICEIDYELVEYNTKCKARVCEVKNCAECCPYGTNKCRKCQPPYILENYPEVPMSGVSMSPTDGPRDPCSGFLAADECVCDPAVCSVPHCAVCDLQNCTHVCGICDVGYKKRPDGSCEVETCYAPGCKDCCEDDYYQCSACLDGYSMAEADYGQCGQCTCDPCNAPYCKTCSPDNCGLCDECEEPYVPDDEGNCICDTSYAPIPHCSAYDRTDCSQCEICDKDYEWDGTQCVCARSEVEHCKDYLAENCKVCKVCYEPYVINEDGTECVCGPSVDHCVTYNEEDCTCNTCEYPLQPAGYPLGSVCGCGDCGYGCDACEPPDCKCTACKSPLVFNPTTSTCECDGCDVKGCEKCDPEDCAHKCKECEPPKELDELGNCRCPDCKIDNCAKCSDTECGTCEACSVFYKLNNSKTECNCAVEFITGCATPLDGPGECGCAPDGCVEPKSGGEKLVNYGGFCFFPDSAPGCDWILKISRGEGTCEDVCADQGDQFKVAVSSGCFGQFADKHPEGMRPGISGYDPTHPPTPVCRVEKGTGQNGDKHHWRYTQGDGGTCRNDTTPAYACICEKERGLLQWFEGNKKPFTKKNLNPEECSAYYGAGCKEICENQNLHYVALPGGYNNGKEIKRADKDPVPYAACSVGDEVGYNVNASPWCGYCLTPTKSSKNFRCLCGRSGQVDEHGVKCKGQGPYVSERESSGGGVRVT